MRQFNQSLISKIDRRRTLQAISAILLTSTAGCTALRDLQEGLNGTAEPTATPTRTPTPTGTEDAMPYTDFGIYNYLDEEIEVTVTIEPDSGGDPFAETFRLDAHDAENDSREYDDIPQMDDEATITVEVNDNLEETYDWNGDTDVDSRGVHVYVETDGIEIRLAEV